MKPFYQNKDKTITLYQGDNKEVMKNLEKETFTACVSDVPYGLSFMGKNWDYDVPSVETNKLVFNLLKAGAYFLSFGGTRTIHRIVVNMEDAGFEIRDMISWLYGCLSEDTEILTAEGFKRYHKDILNDTIICYNIDKDKYENHKPTKKYFYKNKHTAYQIKSNKTDQIVSKDHRVLVERGGRKTFVSAQELKEKENIPFLEDVSELQKTFSDNKSHTSKKKQVLSAMCSFGNIKKEERSKKTGETKMSSMQENILSNRAKQKQIKSGLFQKMFYIKNKSSKNRSIKKECLQRESKLVAKIKRRISETNDRFKQSCLERWFNLQEQERKVCESINQICEMSQRVFSNGEKGRLCYGTPTACSTTNQASFIKNRSRPSHQPQCRGQQVRKSNVIQNKCRTQEIRTRTKNKTTLATITPIEYNGNVWCVEVPTGCFVARRNGNIFLTGNSGFPKSLNIGKAVDKKLGNERGVVGKGKAGKDFSKVKGFGENTKKDNNNWYCNRCNSKINLEHNDNDSDGDKWFGECVECNENVEKWECYQKEVQPKEWEETKGSSEWEGYGTSLKPAQEPISVARKPISEKSVVDNCLKNGTGGLNIDECRVEFQNEKDKKEGQSSRPSLVDKGTQQDDRGVLDRSDRTHITGRFPANIITDGSEEVEKCFPKSNSDNEGSAMRFFYQAKASKGERDAGCDDFEEKKVWTTTGKAQSFDVFESDKNGRLPKKNYHPTVKPIELMRYLVRLVKQPKNNLILDHYAGSGTTAIACILEDVPCVLIEQDKDYCEIIKARLEYWEQFRGSDASVSDILKADKKAQTKLL